MKPINLYTFVQLPVGSPRSDIEAFLSHLSYHNKPITVKEHEYECLRNLVYEMISHKATDNELESFYCSFQVPQVSKEFDLLKIGGNGVLNIELKKSLSNFTNIKNQLVSNKYYLSHFCTTINCYTYISDSKKIYKLDVNDSVAETDINEVLKVNSELVDIYSQEIEKKFRVSDYLVSPINSPERFIKKEYFLSSQQQEIKNQIQENIFNNHTSNAISGDAGTGKTLLLYDIAVEASKRGRVLMIHCGILSQGHAELSEKTKIKIIAIKFSRYIRYNEFDFIFIDEAHRIWPTYYDHIMSEIDFDMQSIIFSYDEKQILSYTEKKGETSSKIASIPGINKFTLTKKIRSNKEIATFITALMDLTKSTDVIPSENIKILYAKNSDTANYLINEMTMIGYTFINYTPSNYRNGEWEKFSKARNAHKVIGQEFDSVVITMGSQFYYDEDGKLQFESHPNPDYIYYQLLYQQVTRTRERICIIVFNNYPLFQNLLSIFKKV